jgi:type I restriction enzyme S subunit
MNAELLLANFNRISDEPDAVLRLRRFILDLAVRGKLVEQDPSDESASELLKKIRAVLAILARKGTIGKPEETSAVEVEEQPFELPATWSWARLGEICSKTGSGSTPRGGKEVYQKSGVPFLRSQNVYDDGLRLDDVAFIDLETHGKMSGTAVEPNDLLLNITGGSIGRCCIVSVGSCPANVSQHVAIIRVATDGTQSYLHQLVLSPYFQSFVMSEQTGAGRGGLPKNRMDRIPVTLPPLAEQHRIVARVRDLMALCDRLEAAQRERETRRDRFAASTHHHLNNGADPQALRSHTQSFVGHLPHLTARPDQVKQLRQTILRLAVCGKLVPQEPSDEPAAQLLERIHTEAERRAKSGGMVMRPTLAIIRDPEIPFILPQNWIWTRLGFLVTGADAGWSPKAEGFPREGNNWGVLKVSAVSWDKFLPDENKQLLPGVRPPETAQVHEGDFLISRANTNELVAKCVLVEHEPEKLILSDKIVRLQISDSCSKKFLSMVNNHAPHARAYYAEKASGTSLSMKNVSRQVIYGLLMPLPPLAEQHRIVAKVDELMALCDQLEAQLTIAQSEASRLLESLLHNALNSSALSA